MTTKPPDIPQFPLEVVAECLSHITPHTRQGRDALRNFRLASRLCCQVANPYAFRVVHLSHHPTCLCDTPLDCIVDDAEQNQALLRFVRHMTISGPTGGADVEEEELSTEDFPILKWHHIWSIMPFSPLLQTLRLQCVKLADYANLSQAEYQTTKLLPSTVPNLRRLDLCNLGFVRNYLIGHPAPSGNAPTLLDILPVSELQLHCVNLSTFGQGSRSAPWRFSRVSIHYTSCINLRMLCQIVGLTHLELWEMDGQGISSHVARLLKRNCSTLEVLVLDIDLRDAGA